MQPTPPAEPGRAEVASLQAKILGALDGEIHLARKDDIISLVVILGTGNAIRTVLDQTQAADLAAALLGT
jgi:hypothetical protein